jgi:WD40 repeat protein
VYREPRDLERGMPSVAGLAHELSVFISYSRRDLELADALVVALEQRGFHVVIDRRDLPYGEEWQNELADFIRASDTVLWLVSPDSVQSRWCNWEVGEVSRLHKRLVPVKIKAIDVHTLPEAIGKIHLFPAERMFSLATDIDQLVTILNTDRAWLKEGTRLAGRAQLWSGRRRDKSLLLRGRELTDAEAWTHAKPNASPPIPSDVLELVLESRRAASRRQKWAAGGALAVAAASISLAILALYQRNEALVSQSLFLSKLSHDNAGIGDSATAVLLALAGLPGWKSGYDRPLVPETLRSLNDGLFSLREVADFGGHQADVNTVVIHPFEPLLLTSSDDRTARIWNARTGELLHVLAGHQDKVNQAAFSPDGRFVGTASDDGTAELWTTVSGRLDRTFVGHDAGVKSIDFANNGSRLVTSSADKTARIWDLAHDGDSIVLRGHTHGLNSAVFSRDGLLVVTTSDDHTAIVWDSTAGTIVAQLVGHTDDVTGGTFDAGGSMVVTFSRDNTARVWSAHGGQLLRTLPHDDWVRSATFCPDSKCVVTASDDGTARVWDLEMDSPPVVLRHADAVRKATIDRRGELIATAGRDGSINVWSMRESKQYQKVLTLAGHTAGLLDITFGPTDEYIATSARIQSASTGERDGTARIWRIKGSTSAIATIEQDTAIQSLAPSSDGKYLATAQGDGTISLWDSATRSKLSDVKAHGGGIMSIAFNADATEIVTASEDGTVAIWRVPQLSLQNRSPNRGSPISDAAFNRNGDYVVIGSYDGSVSVWDLQSGAFKQLERRSSAVVSAKFAPHANVALAAYLDGTAKLWDVDANRSYPELKGHSGPIVHATFSPRHAWVVTSSEDGRTIIWDGFSGLALHEFSHGATPAFSDISGDEQYLATALENSISLIAIDRAVPVALYKGHVGRVNAVRFLPKSLTLMSGSADRTIQIWAPRPNFSDLIAFARDLSPRCLTLDQLKRFSLPLRVPTWCDNRRRTGQ